MLPWLIPLVISAALSGGAYLADTSANNSVADARKAATDAELQRQDQYRDQSRKRFSDLLATQTRDSQDQTQANETAKYEKQFTKNINTNRFSELLPGQGDSSNIVKSSIVGEGTRAANDAVSSAKARAALEALNGLDLSNQIGFSNTRQDIGTIGDLASGSASILPMELEAANGAGSGKRNLAGLLRGLSTAASMYGGYAAMNAPAATAASSAAQTVADGPMSYAPWASPWQRLTNAPAAGRSFMTGGLT